MSKQAFCVFILISLTLTTCGGQPTSVGDPAAGEALFRQEKIGAAPGCVTCHSTRPDEIIVGPSLAGVASRAGSRVEGLSSQAYLRESILEPDAFIVAGFSAGVMYQEFQEVLSTEDADNLVAYLSTLE